MRDTKVIEQIRNIGSIIKNSDVASELDFLALTMKIDVFDLSNDTEEDGEDDESKKKAKIAIPETIIDVNIYNHAVTTSTRAFTKMVYREGLSYLEGNAVFGGVIEQKKYESEAMKTDNTRLLRCMNFLDIPDERYGAIKQAINDTVGIIGGKGYVILLQKDGNKPLETHLDKYTKMMKEKMGFVKISGTCHLCGKSVKAGYEGCGYNCYTNDKNIFNKTYGNGYYVCENCTEDILYGRYYASKFLTTKWNTGKNNFLMVIPSIFDEDIQAVFEIKDIKNGKRGVFKKLYETETEVFEQMGNLKDTIDLVFFERDKSAWKIKYYVSGVRPSRFTLLAKLKRKYKTVIWDKTSKQLVESRDLSLAMVMYYLLGDTRRLRKGNNDKLFVDYNGIFDSGEAKRFLQAILRGEKINRELFLSRMMEIYKVHHLRGQSKKQALIKVYNFLVECGCLENGWNMQGNVKGVAEMKQYTSIEELFEDNKELFDTDKKKAWFLIGSAYSRVIYQSKKYYADKRANVTEDSQKPVSHDISYLENGFIFGKKFDYGTFMDFTTKCTELLMKYGVYSRAGYLKADISKAILLMGGQNTKISTSEAKYMFVAGLNQFIKHEKKEENKEDIELEDEKTQEIMQGDEE